MAPDNKAFRPPNCLKKLAGVNLCPYALYDSA